MRAWRTFVIEIAISNRFLISKYCECEGMKSIYYVLLCTLSYIKFTKFSKIDELSYIFTVVVCNESQKPCSYEIKTHNVVNIKGEGFL